MNKRGGSIRQKHVVGGLSFHLPRPGRTSSRRTLRPSFLLPVNVVLIGALFLVRWGGDLLGARGSIPTDRETAYAPVNSGGQQPGDGSELGQGATESERGEPADAPSGASDGASSQRQDALLTVPCADDELRMPRPQALSQGGVAALSLSLSGGGVVDAGRSLTTGHDVSIPLARSPPVGVFSP